LGALPDNLYTIVSIDASSSKERDVGDYTAVEVLAKDLDKDNYYLRHMGRGRWAKFSKVKAILDYNHAYHPVFNLFENDAYGKELMVACKEEAEKRGEYFPYRLIAANKNKIENAQKVTDLWQKGKVFLPQSGAQRLIDELLMFPFGDYDDCVDGMSIALNFLRWIRKRPSQRKYIERVQLKPNAAGRLT
jgi:predicted phage terminase large subunit-like protein